MKVIAMIAMITNKIKNNKNFNLYEYQIKMLKFHKNLNLNKKFLHKKKMKNRNKNLKIIKVIQKLKISLLFVNIANIKIKRY